MLQPGRTAAGDQVRQLSRRRTVPASLCAALRCILGTGSCWSGASNTAGASTGGEGACWSLTGLQREFGTGRALLRAYLNASFRGISGEDSSSPGSVSFGRFAQVVWIQRRRAGERGLQGEHRVWGIRVSSRSALRARSRGSGHRCRTTPRLPCSHDHPEGGSTPRAFLQASRPLVARPIPGPPTGVLSRLASHRRPR